MRGENSIALFRLPMAVLAMFVAIVMLGTTAQRVMAATEMPQAAGSPLTGISFDDRPLLLPVQRNFQMAMLTSSSQIGRSCGRMEAYGWRVAQSEQHRVNLIFSNTVDRLRGLGYSVEAQTPNSISKDITLFTADRPDKHFLFMWSAGEIGLVMVLCESSPPLTGHVTTNGAPAPSFSPPEPQDVVQSKLAPSSATRGRKLYDANGFTPVGDWVGDYTCMRGYTGATLHIDKFKGDDFKGTVRFYPTAKNPYIPRGSYAVYGQYDRESKRILINPGNWIEHPPGYYKTIIIGNFDPVQRSFSGFFQGIMGCTSFEARSDVRSAEIAPKKKAAVKKHLKAKKKKPPVAKQPEIVPADSAPVNPSTPDEAIAHAPPSTPASGNGTGGSPASAVTSPSTTTPPTTAPSTTPAASPAPPAPPPIVMPEPSSSPAASSLSAPSTPPAPVSSASPAPAQPKAPPAATPIPDATSPSVSPPSAAPKPTSELDPIHRARSGIIMVADWPATPGPPVLPLAPTFSPHVQQFRSAPIFNNIPGVIRQPHVMSPVYPTTPQASRYNVHVPTLEQTPTYNPHIPALAPAPQYYANQGQTPITHYYNTTVPQWPIAPSYTIFKAPGS